ncbi:hypothetical protein TSACC_23065 [Terrimicrobium sacchariphilum]|uniref:Uncharacterized protein n=1 Tax=Terrimicrobium sacchariphilum TaxID=690879 RepID=A0A146GBP1_TERSA|nr:hypothetical protein [Terrimicrobium sacchariphilum]GAT34633.1 hypothetical protein TSACC_23065 [Terrimicrobium sacchariphilum]
MSTIQAILDVDADGSVHLPLPEELRHGKVMIVATLTKVTEAKPSAHAIDFLRKISARGGVSSIANPANWERENRQDRTLPGRE